MVDDVVVTAVEVDVELVEVELVEVELVDVVVVEFVVSGASAKCAAPEGEFAAWNDWLCAYAAIPPETRTIMAATVRSWSLPALTCMLLRIRGARHSI